MTPSDSNRLPITEPGGWDSVWLHVLNEDRRRFIQRGPDRARIERVGNKAAAAALGTTPDDEPAVQQLIDRMAPLMPHLPFDRVGIILAAAVALVGDGCEPVHIGPHLGRLHDELIEVNRVATKAGAAAAQREAQRQMMELREELTAASAAPTPPKHPSDWFTGWDVVWSRLHESQRGAPEPGRHRELVQRAGTEVARMVLGLPTTTAPDDARILELVEKMAPVLTYLPLDRRGFLLAAVAGLAGTADDFAEQPHEDLARLHSTLSAMDNDIRTSAHQEAQRVVADAKGRDERRIQDLKRELRTVSEDARNQRERADGSEDMATSRALKRGIAEAAKGRSASGIKGLDAKSVATLEAISRRASELEDSNRKLTLAQQLLRRVEAEKQELSATVAQLQARLASRARPEPVLLRSWQDAERHAAAWMRYLGYPDAAVTPPGPDGGLDVVSDRAIAQVKAEGHLTGAQVVRQLAGLTVGGTHRGKDIVFFSTFGYSRDAVVTAEEVGVALFRFSDGGEAVAESSAAKRLLEAAADPVSTGL